MLTEARDAVIRVTSTTVCGSDLHMYVGKVSAMEKGDVMGHEFMGIIEDVGPGVQNLKKGDRVVVSAVIACGTCEFCLKGAFSCCNLTNPSEQCREMYGHRLSGIFGYSHLTGGFPGGQAEFVRVPIADVNCLKVPDSLPDDKVLFLSDIICTGWHACEQGEVSEGKVVAVWGCGPVGLMALAWARFRGASKIIAIDNIPERLRLARKQLGAYTINFDEADVVSALMEITNCLGPDVAIETAGFRFPKSLTQKVQQLVKLQTDSLDILNEQIISVKKAGNISLIGDYFGTGNCFNVGAFMEKAITMRGGQVFVQKYWHELLHYIESGQFDPTFVITHRFESLEDIPQAYRMFNKRQDGMIKVLIDVSPSSRTKNVQM